MLRFRFNYGEAVVIHSTLQASGTTRPIPLSEAPSTGPSQASPAVNKYALKGWSNTVRLRAGRRPAGANSNTIQGANHAGRRL
jgi:hypothetical protein